MIRATLIALGAVNLLNARFLQTADNTTVPADNTTAPADNSTTPADPIFVPSPYSERLRCDECIRSGFVFCVKGTEREEVDEIETD